MKIRKKTIIIFLIMVLSTAIKDARAFKEALTALSIVNEENLIEQDFTL
ncbi:MAG: hypothetical protein J7L34_08575 [Thermotogaceae bacterium]|nr:hypothetical protein [Thermotogaceae bacterium]